MNYMITMEQLQAFNEKLKGVKDVNELTGRNGLITELFKETLQNMLEAELDYELGYPKGKGSRILKARADDGSKEENKRNGYTKKMLRSGLGEFEVRKPRDRNGEFQSTILEKYQKSTTNDIENKIISMYGRGMTVSDINEHLADMYGIEVSDGMISEITNKILPKIQEWRSRGLEKVYPVMFIDAIHFKMRKEGKVETVAVYIAIAITVEGKKDILGIWVGSESESAKFWLGVLQDIQARGTEDVLILCSDNLTGISEAAKAVYPKIIHQKCVVHQIRNSLRYIAEKDKKEFLGDLKNVYAAATRDSAEHHLLLLGEKWEKKYPLVIKSWQNNWGELSTYFDFSAPIRKMIYTTNTIEGVNRRYRKVTKNRSVFPNENSLYKILFLATENMMKKWTMPIQNWSEIISQFHIHFEDRIPSLL